MSDAYSVYVLLYCDVCRWRPQQTQVGEANLSWRHFNGWRFSETYPISQRAIVIQKFPIVIGYGNIRYLYIITAGKISRKAVVEIILKHKVPNGTYSFWFSIFICFKINRNDAGNQKSFPFRIKWIEHFRLCFLQ